MLIFGLSVFMLSSSLFFSAKEHAAIDSLEHSNMRSNATEKEETPLVLNGILYRPDLDHWIIWINGVRIYSQRPQSIHGWTIIKVHADSVILRSTSGEELELRPEQDPDLEEFNTSMDESTDDSDGEKESNELDDDGVQQATETDLKAIENRANPILNGHEDAESSGLGNQEPPLSSKSDSDEEKGQT